MVVVAAMWRTEKIDSIDGFDFDNFVAERLNLVVSSLAYENRQLLHSWAPKTYLSLK